MKFLLILTGISLILSFTFNRKKTLEGIKRGVKMFLNILPALFTILIIVSFILSLLPAETIAKWMGEQSGAMGYLIAGILGSISLIPGFIAYPLGGILIKIGISYPVIAMFITTLMMVGILTLPLEVKYFGWKAAILRNVLSLVGAIIVGIAIALVWRLI